MKRVLLGFLFVPAFAFGSPFLVCDPYPTTGQTPTAFVVTIAGQPAPIVTPAVTVSEGVMLKLDLGPLNLSGNKTLTVKARNAWGESPASPTFSFAAGSPGVPGGIGLVAQ